MVTEKRMIDAKFAQHIANVELSSDEAGIVQWVLSHTPTVDAIPIAVMKREIAGINAADQCDQAGRYDFELRNALQTVMKWYDSPRYKETERRT